MDCFFRVLHTICSALNLIECPTLFIHLDTSKVVVVIIVIVINIIIIIIKQPLLSVLCYFVVQGTSPTTDVLSDKGPKAKNEGKGSKGGSPFEEDTGEEIKKALQDEQGHESPKPVPKQTVEDDKTVTTFR